jgi:hypothetical protein
MVIKHLIAVDGLGVPGLDKGYIQWILSLLYSEVNVWSAYISVYGIGTCSACYFI